MKKKGYHILASERYLKRSLKYFLNRKTQWTCDAYKYYLTVCPNGEILPCHRYEDLDWMNRINVLDTNFCEEFISTKMKKQAEGFRNRCPGCSLACYHEMSSFFNDPATFFDMSSLMSLCVFGSIPEANVLKSLSDSRTTLPTLVFFRFPPKFTLAYLLSSCLSRLIYGGLFL